MRLLVATCLIAALAGPALADEQMTPLAAQGNWVAMAHSDSVTDPPDVCLAASLDGFAIRTDQNDNEIRYSNTTWSLPAGVTGSLIVKVNSNTYTLVIIANDDKMVDAAIPTDQLQALVADMNKSATMRVIAGSAAPATISLAGSNTVIAAYLTCANITAPAGETPPGSNPFASGQSQ